MPLGTQALAADAAPRRARTAAGAAATSVYAAEMPPRANADDTSRYARCRERSAAPFVAPRTTLSSLLSQQATRNAAGVVDDTYHASRQQRLATEQLTYAALSPMPLRVAASLPYRASAPQRQSRRQILRRRVTPTV
jgi:hypothetical protein